MAVENFCTKLPNGTPLRQIWSNKSFGVCGSDVVLTLYGGEKKSMRESSLENRVVYNTTSLPRRRDTVTSQVRTGSIYNVHEGVDFMTKML